MTTFNGLMKKTGTICTVSRSSNCNFVAEIGISQWNSKNTIAVKEMDAALTSNDATSKGQHLEAKTGTNCSVVMVASQDKASYSSQKSIILSAECRTPTHGSRRKVTDTDGNNKSDQKMRGGIAG
jgi:hypothetical protein